MVIGDRLQDDFPFFIRKENRQRENKGKMACMICKITSQEVEVFEENVEVLKSYIMK